MVKLCTLAVAFALMSFIGVAGVFLADKFSLALWALLTESLRFYSLANMIITGASTGLGVCLYRFIISRQEEKYTTAFAVFISVFRQIFLSLCLHSLPLPL
jgi:hypothetical protein